MTCHDLDKTPTKNKSSNNIRTNIQKNKTYEIVIFHTVVADSSVSIFAMEEMALHSNGNTDVAFLKVLAIDTSFNIKGA